MTKEELKWIKFELSEAPGIRRFTVADILNAKAAAYNKAIEDCSKKLGIINTLNDLKIK